MHIIPAEKALRISTENENTPENIDLRRIANKIMETANRGFTTIYEVKLLDPTIDALLGQGYSVVKNMNHPAGYKDGIYEICWEPKTKGS